MHSKETDFSVGIDIFKANELTQLKVEHRLMLFDLSVGGHHPAYIQHLLNNWCKQEFAGQLDILVLPKFLKQHSDIVDIAFQYPQKNINFVAITSEEASVLKPRNSSINRALRDFQEWHLLKKYANLLKSTHCLIMYFDTCEYPLILGSQLPCPFSGIYFRPTFHYSDFANYQPSRKERLQEWREKFAMSRILKNPQLQTLYCLDPFVITHIDKFCSKVKAVHLPDPVQIYNGTGLELEKFKEILGIAPGRQVFLLLGSLTDRRKGVAPLLHAVNLLPDDLCQKLCLVFVGEADPIERAPIESQIAAICQAKPVQIIGHYKYISDQDVHACFQLADAIMAPYQRHVGMSGILMLAASAQKPVLSSNYGLMGEIVRRYSLGVTVDSTVPTEIAKGLTRLLLEPASSLCNPATMKSFAQQNSAEEFAHVIFQHL